MGAPERMVAFREWKGWSRAQLGERIGRSESMVGHIETGRRGIGLEPAVRLEQVSESWPEGPIRTTEWVLEDDAHGSNVEPVEPAKECA